MEEQRVSEKAVLRQFCAEKRRLFLAYQQATANYAQIVKRMAALAATAMQAEFKIVEESVRAAHKLSIEARERLDKHRSEHRC